MPPGSQVSRLQVSLGGSDRVRGYLKSGEFNLIFSKFEFVWIQDDAVVSTSVVPFCGFVEAILDVVCPDKSVINALYAIANVRELRRTGVCSHLQRRCNLGVLSYSGTGPMG